MFGVDTSELILGALLALIFIGPKDLPNALRMVGRWYGQIRGMSRHFTSGIESMIREAELEEMEKKWREENESIMREYAALLEAQKAESLQAAGQGKIIYTDIFEAFFAEVKVALFAALMIGFPFFATQMWKFVAPGLYAKEKKGLLPFLLLTPFFFMGGAAFPYFVAMPWALHFLLSFQGDVGGIQREALPGVGNYLSFCTRFLFGFGAAFTLPIL